MTTILMIVSSAATARALPSSQSRLESIEDQAHTLYQTGKYLQSISLLKQLLKIYPIDTSLLTNLGSAEAELSNFTGALSFYKHALSIDSHHIGALLGIGLVLRHLGYNTTSTIYFKKAIAQPITDSKFVHAEEVEKAMAVVYLGNYSQAIDIANKILNHNPSDFGSLEVRSMALSYLGKNNAALTSLNTLISEGHQVPWVLDNRGVVLLNLKNYVAAIANFNASLK